MAAIGKGAKVVGDLLIDERYDANQAGACLFLFELLELFELFESEIFVTYREMKRS